jgi:cell division GTPase FtsZ
VTIVPLESLLRTDGPELSLAEIFKIADDMTRQVVAAISDLITVPGLINLDFADVKTIMSGMGLAPIGAGRASGDNRAVEAAQKAISSPLLDEGVLQHAKSVLINITGGLDLTLHEVNEASSLIREAVADDADIIFGAIIDDSMAGEISVTALFTGMESISGAGEVTRRKEHIPLEPSDYSADALIIWNPEVVDRADYVSLVTALGDLVRSEGGIGVERIGHHGFETPVRVRIAA